MLAVENLGKSYRSGNREQRVFDGLALDVRKGEVVALLGASGSGKTTLLNLLSGIDRPDRGTVQVDGTDIHRLSEPQQTLFRRRHVGFVFQFFNLIPTLTVGENVALPLDLSGVPADTATRRADGLLQAVGLAGMGARFPDTLSGGEQQRTAVARALAHRPTLLLADEPTGNLDEDTGDRVIGLLVDMVRAERTTTIIVTHSRRVAASADRTLVLQHGRLHPS